MRENLEVNRKKLEDIYEEDIKVHIDCNHNVNYLEERNKFFTTIIYIETYRGSGTGVLIDEFGIVLTCYHVVKDVYEIYVKTENEDGTNEIFKADIVSYDEKKDVALLKLEEGEYSFAEIDNHNSKVYPGEPLAILGYPFGARMNDDIMELNISFTSGYASSNQKINGCKRTLLDIAAKAGNSGSPVISLESGKVVGILAGSMLGGLNNSEEINYMIPISEAYGLLKSDGLGKKLGKAYYESGKSCHYGFYNIEEPELAYKCYIKAVYYGCYEAYIEIGDLYRFDDLGEINEGKAIDCYKMAIGKGFLQGYSSIAEIYGDEESKLKNIEKATIYWGNYFEGIIKGEKDTTMMIYSFKSYLEFMFPNEIEKEYISIKSENRKEIEELIAPCGAYYDSQKKYIKRVFEEFEKKKKLAQERFKAMSLSYIKSAEISVDFGCTKMWIEIIYGRIKEGQKMSLLLSESEIEIKVGDILVDSKYATCAKSGDKHVSIVIEDELEFLKGYKAEYDDSVLCLSNIEV